MAKDQLKTLKNWRDGIIITLGMVTVWGGYLKEEVTLTWALFLSVTTGLGKVSEVLTERIQDLMEQRAQRLARKAGRDDTGAFDKIDAGDMTIPPVEDPTIRTKRP